MKDLEKTKKLITEPKKPCQDVELMGTESFNLLIDYCNTNK